MPDATPKEGRVQLEVFRANNASMVEFGFTERRTRTRSDNTAWTSVPEVTRYVDTQGGTAEAGDVYERQKRVQDAVTGQVSLGTWKKVGETRTPEGCAALTEKYDFARDYEVDSQVEPGATMRTPLRLVMIREGVALTRPLPGELDRDPATGALLETTVPE